MTEREANTRTTFSKIMLESTRTWTLHDAKYPSDSIILEHRVIRTEEKKPHGVDHVQEKSDQLN